MNKSPRIIDSESEAADLRAGDIVLFGRYYQDLNELSPVKWRVLDVADDKALLLSDRALESMCFKECSLKAEDVASFLANLKQEMNWSASDLRRWLNGDFWDICFNQKEQSLIASSHHMSGLGEETEDRLFLLSQDEVEKYFPEREDRLTEITMHIIMKKYPGVHDLKKLAKKADLILKNWWLRTSGSLGVHYVAGFNNKVCCGIEHESNLVRPALWLCLSCKQEQK